jgi:hypothetical protein
MTRARQERYTSHEVTAPRVVGPSAGHLSNTQKINLQKVAHFYHSKTGC